MQAILGEMETFYMRTTLSFDLGMTFSFRPWIFSQWFKATGSLNVHLLLVVVLKGSALDCLGNNNNNKKNKNVPITHLQLCASFYHLN